MRSVWGKIRWSRCKVVDHCHYSGQFIGFAHNQCNIQRRSLNFTPIVAHNLTHYDLHYLCLALHSCSPEGFIKIIPQTDEKYVWLSLKVPIGEYRRKNGEKATICEEMRFIDSLRFMGMGLEKLVSFLPKDAFEILDTHFASNHSKSDIELLHHKGFYPYAYADKLEKFNEPELPRIEKWTDALQGGDISINDENFRQAKKVFDIFGC